MDEDPPAELVKHASQYFESTSYTEDTGTRYSDFSSTDYYDPASTKDSNDYSDWDSGDTNWDSDW